jgi:hypothetical protein
MRLTLRTLLAYHHGVLAPNDHADLHHRIQASPDAGNLLRRIDALTIQPQLLSPPLVAKGPANLASDPNSVAEYLDDALKGPMVPELERVCLEHDMHLAELAHCHELLATAMNTQVAVPNLLRENAIKLADPAQRAAIESQLLTRTTKRVAREIVRTDHAHVSSAVLADAVQVSAPMVASGGESIRPEGLSLENAKLAHEVPEYLIGSSRGRWKIPIAMAALTALLALLIWQTLGPWERVWGLFLATPEIAEAADIEEPPLVVRELAPVQAEPDDRVFHELIVSEEVPPSVVPTEGTASQADVDASDEAPPMPASPEAIESSDDAPPLPPATITPNTNDSVSLPHWHPANSTVGELVLVQKENRFERLQPDASIDPNTTLLMLPTATGAIELPNQLTWMARGASRLQVNVGSTPCNVTTSLCKAMLHGQTAGDLLLTTPAGVFEISLPDEKSFVSVEVSYRQIAYGSVVDRRAYVPAVIIVAAEGAAKVSHTMGQQKDSHALAIGEGVAIIEGRSLTKFRLTNIPDWFRPNNLRPIDMLAAEDLSNLAVVKDGKTLADTLLEISSNRRPETASLAIQAMMLAGNWSPFVGELLGSDRLRSHWATTSNLARQLLAITPSESAPIRDLFVDKYGVKQGEELFQMLSGLPEEQLIADGISNLISQLDSDSMATRVLAAYQLELLTGKSLAYQPYAPNRASIQQWRREAATKKLSVLPLADPITEQVPQ